MKIFFNLLFVSVVFISLRTESIAFAEDSCQLIGPALQAAESVRGLKARKKVPCALHSKAEVEGFLRKAIHEKMPAEKLRFEEKAFRIFGFIPEKYEYAQGILDIYLGQIGGYYDPEKASFVMADWMPAFVQQPIAVHELVHALQDQKYNLESFTDEKKFSSDELLARSALIEGDATAVMTDYVRGLQGQGPLMNDKSVEGIILQNVLGASFLPSTQSAPPALLNLLFFPYNAGLRFAHYALQKQGGYAGLDKIFRNPPRSSEEILHPELYFENKTSFRFIPDEELLALGKNEKGKLLYRDTLGEIGISAFFSSDPNFRTKGPQAAAGWAGDAFAFLRRGEGKEVFVWKSLWDSEKEAEEFYKSFGEFLAARNGWKSSAVDSKKMSVKSPFGVFHVERSGVEITFLSR